MRLFPRQRLRLALFICPTLRAFNGPEAARALDLPCDWLHFGAKDAAASADQFDEGCWLAPEDQSRRFRFKIEERPVVEPTQPAEFLFRAEPQAAVHKTREEVILLRCHRRRLRDLRGQLRAGQKQPDAQSHDATPLAVKDSSTFDQAGSRQGHEGDLQ